MNTNNKIEMGRLAAKEKIAKTIKMIEKLPKAVKYSNTEFDDFRVSRKICTDINLYKAFENQPQYPATLTKAKISVKKIPSWEWSNSGYPLNTPALVEAFERGILNLMNYNRIKNGGMITVEKYSEVPEGIKNCYNKIPVPKTDGYIIIRVDDSLNDIVELKKRKFKKEREQFELEFSGKRVSYPNNLKEEFSTPEVLAHAAIFGGGNELNNLQMLFTED